MKPNISIIMPVYNPKEDEFRQSIESILNQTYEDYEFILIDDGSTMDIESVVKSYSDTRIKLYRNETNQKIVKTLNRGLSLAQGDYIARLDSDDYSEPTRLEKQFDYLEDNEDIGLVGTFYKRQPANERGFILPHLPQDVKIMLRYCFNCLVHSSVMFRKSILDKHNITYNENCLHAEDHKMWSDITDHTDVAIIPEYLTNYRNSPDGISENNRPWQYKMVMAIALENIIRDFAFDKNKPNLYHILMKFMAEQMVTVNEFTELQVFLLQVIDYLYPIVSPPFNNALKNYILSPLKYLKR